MPATMKQLETELGEVRQRLKVLEGQLKEDSVQNGSVNSNISRLADSIAELKQNFNTLHGSLQERLKVIYEQLKK